MTAHPVCARKRTYPSQAKAEAEIARAIRTLRGGPIPVRAYLCPHCRRWHTTKKPTWP